jgi:hypothetical protein
MGFFIFRPLLDHASPLPDRQSYSRPMTDRLVEYLARFIQAAAGVQHPADLGAVLGPFLDIVEVALVREFVSD